MVKQDDKQTALYTADEMRECFEFGYRSGVSDKKIASSDRFGIFMALLNRSKMLEENRRINPQPNRLRKALLSAKQSPMFFNKIKKVKENEKKNKK